MPGYRRYKPRATTYHRPRSHYGVSPNRFWGSMRQNRRRMFRTSLNRKMEVHSFKRTFGVGFVNNLIAGPQNLSYEFLFNQLPNFSEYADMFDQYKVNKLVYHFEPCFNEVAMSSVNTTPAQSQTAINTWARIVHDYDDSTPLTSEDDYYEYANMKSFAVARNKPFNVVLYPKIKKQLEVVAGVALGDIVSSSRCWIDMAYPNVPMYGLKLYVPAVGSFPNGFYLFNITCTAYFQCKNTR